MGGSGEAGDNICKVRACASRDNDKQLEQVQEGAGWAILGVSESFLGVVIREDLWWGQLKFMRHSKALGDLGRLRALGKRRWPKIVGEAIARNLGSATWADYMYKLMEMYALEA